MLPAHKVKQARRIAAPADHVEAGALKQACQALAKQNIVVSQRNPGPLLSHPSDYRPPREKRIQAFRLAGPTS